MTFRRSRPGTRTNSFRAHYKPTKSKQPRKTYIHPSRFVKPATPQAEAVVYTPTHSFSDFKLNAKLLDNISAMGYQTPSAIQDQAIPLGLDGKDVVGIANTGTGKTAAFALPILNHLMENRSKRVLVMAPTRELAQQIFEQFKEIGKGSGLFGTLLIGGVAMGPQVKDLRDRPPVVIGTPGRIKDHLERGNLDLSSIAMIVLDEVDRMLDMGFIGDITHILSSTPREKQSFYFSATLDNKVKTIIETFSVNPQYITVAVNNTSDNVEQDIVPFTDKDDKINKLHNLLLTQKEIKAIVFDDTKRSTEKLAKELASRGFSADSIHGGKSQSQRQKVLHMFKKTDIRVLVATDVAARGIDVADVTHVINYTTPQTYEDYIHRIGRTGRANRTGFAYTFIEFKDRQF